MPLTLLEKNRRANDTCASHYRNFSQLANLVNERLMGRLALLPIEPESILEIGCGPGDTLDELHKRYPNANLFGLDLSLTMLSLAKKNHQLICSDAHYLPLRNHSVDLIYSNFMLEWSPHLPSLLKEIKRVLSPNGVFFFSTLGPGTLKELRKAWRTLDDKHDHVNFFSDMHDIGDLLQKLKFKEPVMDREDLTLLYKSPIKLLKELKRLGSHKTAPHIVHSLGHPHDINKLQMYYEKSSEHPEYYPATAEVIYGHAFGSRISLEDEQQGISRIGINTIKRKGK